MICVTPEGLLHPSPPILATGRSQQLSRKLERDVEHGKESTRERERERETESPVGKIKKGTNVVRIVILSRFFVHIRVTPDPSLYQLRLNKLLFHSSTNFS